MTEGKEYKIHCPDCGGRLFDVIAENDIADIRLIISIKCWKCRKIIRINRLDYLVQESHDNNKQEYTE